MEKILYTFRQSDGPCQKEALASWLEGQPTPSPIYTAEVELARGLAAAVDLDVTNPALWRQYRDAVRLIRESFDAHHDGDDPLAGLGVDVPSEVRDDAKP